MPKRNFDKLTTPIRISITAGAGVLFALICNLFFALIAYMSSDPAANLTLYGEICLLLSMLFCGFFGAKIENEQKFVCGMASGSAMLAIVIMFALFFSSGGFVKALILSVLSIFLCAVGAAVGSRKVKRKRR